MNEMHGKTCEHIQLIEEKVSPSHIKAIFTVSYCRYCGKLFSVMIDEIPDDTVVKINGDLVVYEE